jgi:phosphoribosyl 1,2-cyclic phosphodiesterase
MSYEYQLPVYATEKVHQGIERNYCVQRKIRPELKRLVVHGETFRLGDFTITPFNVPHDASDNTGFFIEAQGTSFCLITDAGCVTDEMKNYINKSDYLVIEANHDVEMLKGGPYPKYLKDRIMSDNGHLSNADCARALAENMSEGLKHVWLCHLSEENNHPELARKTIESILRQYGIVADKDFALEVLKRNVPTGIFDLV